MNVPSKTLGKFAIVYEERKLIGVMEERVVPLRRRCSQLDTKGYTQG